MKTKLLAMMLLAGGSMFAETRVSIGIGFGGAGSYQPPPSYASNIPPCPGPGYTWVDGYWSQNHGRNNWIAGYWNRQPYSSSYPVAPRFKDNDDHRGSRSFEDRNPARDFGHNQNRGFDDRDGNRNGYTNGFRGR